MWLSIHNVQDLDGETQQNAGVRNVSFKVKGEQPIEVTMFLKDDEAGRRIGRALMYLGDKLYQECREKECAV